MTALTYVGIRVGFDKHTFQRDVSRYDRRQLISVREARARVRKVLEGTPRVEDAELAVSELLSNTIQHGTGTWVELAIDSCDEFTHIETISPASDGAPPADPGEADLLAEAGRGLWIVANVSDAHGHRMQHGAAIDWFELAWTEDRTTLADVRKAWLIWSATGCPSRVPLGWSQRRG